MKGGITSGVVYPAAVAEIAKSFVFRNIGGTSAGAIAAALTAAAERRRQSDGSMGGFDRIASIPEYLASNDHLYRLFQPNASTKGVYRTIVGLFGRAKFNPSWLAKVCVLFWAFPITALAGSAPGMVALIAIIRTIDIAPLWFSIIAFVLASITLVCGSTFAALIAITLSMSGKLPKNFFGMVTGVDDKNRQNPEALCTWLANELSACAGIDAQIPLTFGMLWNARRSVDDFDVGQSLKAPDVNLEMITTNLTWGRPHNFPIEGYRFFFSPSEMQSFFPDHVVTWLVNHARQPRDAKEAGRFNSYLPLLPLPEMANLPVIVATRMSLAFPLLLSAVPLWSADFSATSSGNAPPALEHVWFSDGGISSNFPVTLFDSPLPRWPTFAINLSDLPRNRKIDEDETRNVYMTRRSQDGLQPNFRRISSLLDLLLGAANAMQNWNDSTQMVLPGYRDRIVTIFLGPTEGGLNLDMPKSVLMRLRDRGTVAGRMLVERFGAPSVLDPAAESMGWEAHRWVRFRATMGSLRQFLSRFSSAYESPVAPDVTFEQLINATAGVPCSHYPLDRSDRVVICSLSSEANALGTALSTCFAVDDRLPKPMPDLVVRHSLKL